MLDFPISVYLVREIFKQNKFFLNRDVSHIIKEIVKVSEDLELSDVSKSSYLKALQVFVKYKNKIIKKNQQDIVIQLTSSSRSELFNILKPGGQTKIGSLLKKMSANEQDGTLELPAEVYNIICFLDTFTLCTEGKHEVTEAKAQTSVMDLHAISDMLKDPDLTGCWPLREAVVHFLEDVFLITEKGD